MKKQNSCSLSKKTSIGGQALMEGIMMRGPQKSAMAVRRPNGSIFFEEEENTQKRRPRICRLPVIRGVFAFVDSMVLGYKYLMKSAEIYCEEEEKKSESGEESTKESPQSAFGKTTMAIMGVAATVLGVALALFLFVWLPTFLYTLLAKHVSSPTLRESRLLRSSFEGVFKILILVAYMALVSLMKDIRRTFMYHGAEHKTIFCYEQGLPLTVENVRAQRRFHPRCGTSFLILMLLVSIVAGMFIPTEIGTLSGALYTVVRAAIKILLIPVIMGVGYELLKLAGKYDNLFTRIISAPGMWLQRITVREPDDGMIECAIMAFVAVMPEGEKEAYGVAEQSTAQSEESAKDKAQSEE